MLAILGGMAQETQDGGALRQQERAAWDGGEGRPSRQALLVAVSAGLGYMFDAYVVNIYSFVGFLIGPETKGRPLAELDGVDPRAV